MRESRIFYGIARRKRVVCFTEEVYYREKV
jgi:hypothetical protein